ncbi:GroES-like protein [Myriangium duriaei CBS 260.36]|uniref:GroES-like protein n=1 Tax=Myriangium duriaei CBS 260.36 TaxID=1168546 RepID=A0A9P4J6B3_9PEZI|nr:GroES-like protein [Myriangium duriaei CBS 260.36]
MKEAHVDVNTNVTVHDVPKPQIREPNDIVIKVVVAGCNPKDWKMQAGILKTIADCPNSGDDIAGIVEEVGSAVAGFHKGDRVAALHQLGSPHGAYAEYALVKDFATFHLGDEVPFESAAAVPMAAFMAAIGLFGNLRITSGLWHPLTEPTPLVIYGAAGAVGSMAVKMGQVVGAHPMICIAGKGEGFVRGLIDESKGDTIVDYRKGDEAVVEGIKAALKGKPLLYAFDAVSEKGSYLNIAKVLEPDRGRITLALPGHAQDLPEHFETSHIMAGSLWKKLEGRHEGETLGNLGINEGGPDFARAFSTNIGSMFRDGRLKPHTAVVVDGGLESGLETALKRLREGKVSAEKLVIKVA